MTFEPSGPVAGMLNCELRGKPRGTRTALLEQAIVKMLGRKYPKLRMRYRIITYDAQRVNGSGRKEAA